ncbi:MAG: hypothetical protein NTV51_06425 [Verrucomicrobia bacterium]|nr:hypothetical protein [Verrucomicrobiota bacterium]
MKIKSFLALLLVTAASVAAVEPPKNQPPAPAKIDSTQPAAEKPALTVRELEASLKKARSELSEMRVRYMDKHPKVQQQLRTIARLEMDLAKQK